MPPKKVCLVGSGNWGSAVAVLIGQNVLKYTDTYDPVVNMYVYEEKIEHNGTPDRNLSEVINETNENVKYLPGIKLPTSIKAEPDLAVAAKDADLLIWVVPHQFVPRMIGTVKGVARASAVNISLIKGGIDIKDGVIELCSDLIKAETGQPCLVLMGANLANEVARGDFCEATVGYDGENAKEASLVFQKLFTTNTFSVRTVSDVAGVELCGALKNIVALGAGFVDGLGMGSNTKAAAIRLGLQEMKAFIQTFYPKSYTGDTFFESCGVADLITTCFGGRNRKCAEAWMKSRMDSSPKSWAEVETELLNGQKLQGTLTCEEIMSVLKKNGKEKDYPFFLNIYDIAFKGKKGEELFQGL